MGTRITVHGRVGSRDDRTVPTAPVVACDQLGAPLFLVFLPQRRSVMRPTKVIPMLLAVALGCEAAPSKDTSAEAKRAIDAANATWAGLTSNGHADSLASYYHPKAVLLPPNMAPVRGREAIRGFFAQMNAMAATLSIRAESVWASGPSATELGRWNFVWSASAKRPPGFPPADSGKY